MREYPFTKSRRPSWDVNGGKWYVSSTPPRNGEPWKMERWKPSINAICEPLLGSTRRSRETNLIEVRYPTPDRAIELYCEGIELVRVFGEPSDLVSLALHRTYVAPDWLDDNWMDVAFFNTAIDLGIHGIQWLSLAERMPEHSWIRGACVRRSHGCQSAA